MEALNSIYTLKDFTRRIEYSRGFLDFMDHVCTQRGGSSKTKRGVFVIEKQF